MKIFCLLTFLVPLLTLCGCAMIECNYDYDTSGIMGRLYVCYAKNDLNILSVDDTQISYMTGMHKNGHGNDIVEGFSRDGPTIKFFPKGLDKFLKNLKVISIRFAGMKEIHQFDLKPFPKLEYINLAVNDIEVLEEGLFAFNPWLIYIAISGNKINKIDPKVFDHLNGLIHLHLQDNECITRGVYDDPATVRTIIQEVKIQCLNFVSSTTTLPSVTLATTIKSETCNDQLKTSISDVNKEVLHMKEEIKKELSENFEDIITTCESSSIAIYGKKIENIENNLHRVSSALLIIIEKINELKDAVDELKKNEK